MQSTTGETMQSMSEWTAEQQARRRHLQLVHERHEQHPDFEDEIAATLSAEQECPRWAPVSRDADPDSTRLYAIGLFEDRAGALGWLSIEPFEWEPHALYDLDTGRSLPLNVSVRVTVPDDPTATVEDDLRDYTRVITTEWTESVHCDTRYETATGRQPRASQLVHGDTLRGGAIVLSVEPASIGTPRYRPARSMGDAD